MALGKSCAIQALNGNYAFRTPGCFTKTASISKLSVLSKEVSSSHYGKLTRRHGVIVVRSNLKPDEKISLPPSQVDELDLPKELSAKLKKAFNVATNAVENVSVATMGTAALYTGVAAVSTLVASHVVGSIDTLPFVPGVMQFAGLTYCGTAAVKYLSKEKEKHPLEPTSPIRVALDFVGSPPSERFARAGVELPADVEPKVQRVMQKLVDQRNAAVKQAQDIRAASSDLTRLMAEKDALESVALQLAQERDSAMTELNTLKISVEAMTERMKSIDEMLSMEVRRLQEQNAALESVAFALASERDTAIKEVEGFKVIAETRDEEKKALEILATELIQERDAALNDVNNYKKIVAELSEATGSSSGLTSQQEVFLKSRIRSVRSQFVDITKSYEQQRDRVDLLVAHLAEDFGAPADWTLDYMKQFLRSSSEGHTLATPPHKVVKKVQDTFTF